MADAAIFIGWGRPIDGREKAALQVFGESMAYYGSLQAKGTIESFEPVILSPHGGDLAGFVLIRGDAGKLAALKATEEFQRQNTRAGFIVNNLGVIDASIGASLAAGMAQYQKEAAELT